VIGTRTGDAGTVTNVIRTATRFEQTVWRSHYGERYHAGDHISSCLAESSVNAVISKRFAKRQQMQWTKRGAHLLLRTRTRALDEYPPATVRALVSWLGKRQCITPRSRRSGITTPHIVMLAKYECAWLSRPRAAW
jgi:hypothetical protein